MSPCSKAFTYLQVDRISKLPEDVMSNILSHLPTKDALATSVLSRDWEHKWASIYDIDITDECYVDEEDECSWPLDDDLCEDKLARFCGYVDKVLNREASVRNVGLFLGTRVREDSGLRTLSSPIHDFYQIRTWISKILRLNVKKLTIIARNLEYICNNVLPKSLERCTSLTELKLEFPFTLKIRDQTCFPQLESLYLSGEDSDIRLMNKQSSEPAKFILSFPKLKNLELATFEFMNAKLVEINVPELIHFNSCRSRHSCDFVIKINAPKLVRYVSDLSPVYEFVQSVPSLRYLELRGMFLSQKSEIYSSRVKSHITALLRGSVNLECLLLKGTIIKDFLKWKLVHFLPSLNQLKRVALNGRIHITTKHLWEFLQATPYLEHLILAVDDFETLEKPLPPCVVSRLKIVTFIRFNGYSWEIRLAKLFLEKARNLQSLVLNTWNDSEPGPEPKYESPRDVAIDQWMNAFGPENANRITIMDNKVGEPMLKFWEP